MWLRLASLAPGGLRLPEAWRHWYGLTVVSEARSNDPDADQELVRRMAQGDAGALGALYDRHASLVFSLVRRIVRVTAEAEELVHDVFLEAWRRASSFDDTRGTVRTWLLLRARSRALDHLKSATVKRTVALGDGQLAALSAEVGSQPLVFADLNRVRQALLELPAEQRQVLVLGYFEGLSSSEIAAHMGTPVGTVKSRVAAAMARLRAALLEGEA